FLLSKGVGSPTWTRTRDLRINSPSLYQLSYQGILFRRTLVFPLLVQRLKGAHITRYRDASQTPAVVFAGYPCECMSVQRKGLGFNRYGAMFPSQVWPSQTRAGRQQFENG